MYEIALWAHWAGLALSTFYILRADHMGARWMLGKTETLDASRVAYLHKGVWAGLGLLYISGIFLILPIASYIIEQQMFQAKMLFVLALTANGYMIGKIDHIASTRSFASLSLHERFPLILSGAISTICWIGSFVAGISLFPGWALW